MSNLNYDFLDGIRKMPPLKHSKESQNFDIAKSEVAQFISSRPEVMQKNFNMAMAKKAIVFDPITKTWRGADYDV